MSELAEIVQSFAMPDVCSRVKVKVWDHHIFWKQDKKLELAQRTTSIRQSKKANFKQINVQQKMI